MGRPKKQTDPEGNPVVPSGYKAFSKSAEPSVALPGKDGFVITNWWAHRQYEFCFVAQGPSEGSPSFDETHFLCDRCHSWLRFGGGANLLHHLEHVHPEVIVEAKRPKATKEDLLLLLLEEDLPFTLVEAPRFRKLTGSQVGRLTVSNLANEAKIGVTRKLTKRLRDFSNFSLAFDDWTDCMMNQYMGVKVQAVGAEYCIFCLDHFPLTAETADAKTLARLLTRIMEKFGITIHDQVRRIVTDTTAVMPKTVELLKKKWIPCFAHVLNLMLHDVLEVVHPRIKSLFDAVHMISGSLQWPKLVKGHKVCTIPSYCPTRWYSLAKMLTNALRLREEINVFLRDNAKGEQPAVISDATWSYCEQFLSIVESFQNASELLENDDFGSISHVFEARAILDIAFERLNADPLFVDAWASAISKHWDKHVQGATKDLLIRAIYLNPFVMPSACLTIHDRERGEDLLKSDFKKVTSAGRDPPDTNSEEAPKSKYPGATRADLVQSFSAGDELSNFMAIRRNALPDISLMEWWKQHKAVFPNIWILAAQFLVVPATSAGPERQFSRAKRLKSKKRASMSPTKLQSMVFLGENLAITEEVLEAMKKSRDD
jgi:hypothetical protein